MGFTGVIAAIMRPKMCLALLPQDWAPPRQFRADRVEGTRDGRIQSHQKRDRGSMAPGAFGLLLRRR